jgi:cobalt/nickel transport system permease protein
MHMADALLSPAVGGTMWAATAAAVVICSRRVRQGAEDRRAAMMGVLGAFLFAAQMINFSIPGTGSSGHLGGGLLLAILLGPDAAFLVVASVLIIQALFFADGGLLALGCNIFNLGFLPAFVGYPLYRGIAGASPGTLRMSVAAMLAAVVSLQVGAFAVVLETVTSGISALPLHTFAAFMLPIHLAIGIVEGLVTVAVASFLRAARPGILEPASLPGRSIAGVATTFLAIAVALAGMGAWFASKNPDGLEWSLDRTIGVTSGLSLETNADTTLGRLQQRVAVLPNYGFRPESAVAGAAHEAGTSAVGGSGGTRLGTSVAGLTGDAMAMTFALLIGLALRSKPGPH